MKAIAYGFFILGCMCSTGFIQAHQPDGVTCRPNTPSSETQFCPCGCGCVAPCNCGCMQGRPCTCHR